jgi:penicillin-binding protein 2
VLLDLPRPVPLPRGTPLRIHDSVEQVERPFFHSPDFFGRVAVLSLVVAAALSVLFLRLWSLEVLHGREYAHVAARQTARIVLEPGPRGPITDARGRLLADSEGQNVVHADARALGVVGDDGVWRPTVGGHALLDRLARLAHARVPDFVRRIRDGLVRSPFAEPIVVPRAPRDLVGYLMERQDEFPGLHVGALPLRGYPQGAFGAPFLGLIGEIGANQLQTSRFRGYEPGELIGTSGVESAYDRLLRGGLHRTRVVVDALGRPRTVRDLEGPRPHGLQLTIDARLQRAVERALQDGIQFAHAAGHLDAHAGAAVVLDPHTGAVKALATYPTFSQVAAARNPDYLAQLYTSGSRLLDRATQGIYPAGSTFKPIVAAAALQAGVISPYSVLPCTGSLDVGGHVFHNVEAGINASLSLPQAIQISCDTWFYRLGLAMAGDHARALRGGARRLGFGRVTGLDLPGEASGLIPQANYAGDAVNLSIGQGGLQITPLQLAVAYSALANGGTLVRPHVARAVLTSRGRVKRVLHFRPRAHVRLPGLAAIRDGLYRAANDPGGTSAAIFSGFPVKIDGKTGTAEAPPGSDHSWYASWAPAEDPKIVVVVLIEHGGFGAEAAAPAAREIYSAYFGVRQHG